MENKKSDIAQNPYRYIEEARKELEKGSRASTKRRITQAFIAFVMIFSICIFYETSAIPFIAKEIITVFLVVACSSYNYKSGLKDSDEAHALFLEAKCKTDKELLNKFFEDLLKNKNQEGEEV